MPLEETEEEEFPFAYGDVFDAAAEAVAAMKRFRLERSSKSTGKIAGKVGSIWWTGVQMITIVVSETSPGQTVVSVTSALPEYVRIDHGKNRENVNRLLDSIEEILGRKFPAQEAEQGAPGDIAAEYRLREQLRPLEQLLAAGTITPEEFEATRDRIVREAGRPRS
jgi:hypothetical protein